MRVPSPPSVEIDPLRPVYEDFLNRLAARKRGIVIASSQRSGTHLLGHHLSAGGLGLVGENLLAYIKLSKQDHIAPDELSQAFCHCLSLGSGGTAGSFGLVLMDYVDVVLEKLAAAGIEPSNFALALSHLPWAWLRRDAVDVAVSHHFAIASGVWEAVEGTQKAVEYDFEGILRWYHHIGRVDAYWDGFFRRYQIKPFQIWYEDVAAKTERLQELLRFTRGQVHLLDPADLPERLPHGGLKRDFAERFRRELALT